MKQRAVPILLIAIGFITFIALKNQFDPNKSKQQIKEQVANEPQVVQIKVEDLKQLIHSAKQDVVLVNVWATWCGPCVYEFPFILELHKKYANQGLQLIFVSTDDVADLPRVKEFLQSKSVDFETYMNVDSDDKLAEFLSAEWSGAIPASFIFSKDGKLLDSWTGDRSFEFFEKQFLSAKSKIRN